MVILGPNSGKFRHFWGGVLLPPVPGVFIGSWQPYSGVGVSGQQLGSSVQYCTTLRCNFSQLFLFLFFFLKSNFRSWQYWRKGSEVSLDLLPLHNILHQDGAFVTIDEPTLTHRNHPDSIVYLMIHSWHCTPYGFGQIYNDIWASQVVL